MKVTAIFPTEFACAIAKKAGLMPPDISSAADLYSRITATDTTEEDAELFANMYMALREFQQIASVGSYDQAIFAFHNFEISPEQETALRLIAEITPSWVRGQVASTLMEKLGNDQKAMASIAETLLDALNTGKMGKGTGAAKGVIKQFYMELTSDD